MTTTNEEILYEHGFLESQGKPGLHFMKPDEDGVVFIDLRKGSPRAYGFRNNEPMTLEAVQVITKKAVNAIKMNAAKASGQMELEVE